MGAKWPFAVGGVAVTAAVVGIVVAVTRGGGGSDAPATSDARTAEAELDDDPISDRVRNPGTWMELPIGRATAAPDLPDGTVLVYVTAEQWEVHSLAEVHLKVDGVDRVATTDDEGVAAFTKVPAGAKVVAVAGTNARATSKFALDAHGGARVWVSTIEAQRPTAHVPERKESGHSYFAEDLPIGDLEVWLVYEHDPEPPGPHGVQLVGYSADDKVSVSYADTDDNGFARFDKLDVTGGTAYYVVATLPRNGASDRLAAPIVPGPNAGTRVALVALSRTSSEPPLEAPDPSPAAGKVLVSITGIDAAKVDIVDAKSGSKLATVAVTKGEPAIVDVAALGGQVLYAESHDKGLVRSGPILAVADRGAAAQLSFEAPIQATFRAYATPEDDRAAAELDLLVGNFTWRPQVGRIVLPLPDGATDIRLRDTDLARVVPDGIELTRPLQPGTYEVHASLELRGRDEVAWRLPLPRGARKAQFVLTKVPGGGLEPPRGLTTTERTTKDHTYTVIDGIDLDEGKPLALTIRLPKPAPDADLQHACRRLFPDRTALVGKPARDFELRDVNDGEKLSLESLRGKVVLVNFMSTWNYLTKRELTTLAALAKHLPKLRVVLVASEKERAEIDKLGGDTRFPVLLDEPPPDTNIGKVTAAYGISQLPESVLVDRDGVVRFHFQNWRNWSEASATRCVKALLDER